MNRGHHHDATIDAIERSRGRGFEICGHVMLGLPGESHADMLATAREVARLGFDAVKIHNLYAVKNTPLAEQVARGEVTLLGRDEYIRTLVDFLELLPPEMVVERISGDAPPDYFIGPAWCLDKPGVLRALHAELERRDTWQGKCAGSSERVGCSPRVWRRATIRWLSGVVVSGKEPLMCCFTGNVESVSATKIFARPAKEGRQFVVYHMRYRGQGAAGDGAAAADAAQE